MRDAFTRALMREAAKDPKLTLVTGDLGFGVLKPFWETYPEQFVNAGIAEQHQFQDITPEFWQRLFAVNVALSFALTWLIGLTGVLPFGIRVIGYLVPALLVRDLQRQGFVKTGISLLSVTALCALCLLWVGML